MFWYDICTAPYFMIQKVLRQRKDGENNRSPLRPQPYFTIVWDFAEILPAMFLLGL